MRKFSVQLDEIMPLIREQLEAGQTVQFSPKGTSMLPMLRQGRDTVILSPLPPRLKKYDLPLYQREDGQYVLHRIVSVRDTYTCIGDNQFAYEKGVQNGQMIALVTAFTRDGRQHSTSEISHRLYCRFWHYSRPIRYLWRRAKEMLGRILARHGR